MPPKKNPSSWKLKAFVIVIIFILTASYGISFLNLGFMGVALPPASSFVTEDWMNLLPEGASYSRFLNYTDFEDLTDIFPDTVALYLWDIGYNLSVFDVNSSSTTTINETDVLALNLNSSIAKFHRDLLLSIQPVSAALQWNTRLSYQCLKKYRRGMDRRLQQYRALL